ISMIGGIDKMHSGASRDRVFSDALTFAQKTAAEERPNKIERTNALYDRAGKAADNAQQKVHYRMSRAKFAEAQKDPELAVRLYQEILSDGPMRAVALMDESAGSPGQAEEVAEKAIDK